MMNRFSELANDTFFSQNNYEKQCLRSILLLYFSNARALDYIVDIALLSFKTNTYQ